MSKDSVSIKPCPFGHESKAEDFQLAEFAEGKIAVVCTVCGCIGPIKEDKSDALESWNRRLVVLLEKEAYDKAKAEMESNEETPKNGKKEDNKQ